MPQKSFFIFALNHTMIALKSLIVLGGSKALKYLLLRRTKNKNTFKQKSIHLGLVLHGKRNWGNNQSKCIIPLWV